MAMPVEMSVELEHLLVDLLREECLVETCHDQLMRRQMKIMEPLAKELKAATAAEYGATRERLGHKLVDLHRRTYRSELAQLAAALVTAERNRAQIMRRLEAFPQLGESVPAVGLAVEYDGERGFIIKTGGGRSFRFSLPAIIWRGLWRADTKYERGDAVTYDGSLWITTEDSPAHEPGKGPQWRVAAMKGRNGRDASPHDTRGISHEALAQQSRRAPPGRRHPR
jgi:hypothetical protein